MAKAMFQLVNLIYKHAFCYTKWALRSYYLSLPLNVIVAGWAIYLKKKIMFQWIEARRGAPREATCEKSVCGPSKVAGQGPQSESIRHYIDKECLEKIICADWLH